jgi:nucleotide-binding universal stress UspA family protein
MLTIDRILWPTDLSEGAERAFPHAVAFADWHEADLHILHVVDEGAEAPEAFPLSEGTLGNYLPAGKDAGPSLALGDLSIHQEQRAGAAPPQAIVGYAEEEGIDLIVMGTHGQRGLRRFLIGSVTEEVVRTAPCPVLTARAGSRPAPARNVRNILAPVDFSDASTLAVRHARELALTYGSQVTLLHAVEEAMYPSAYGVETAPLPKSKIVQRVEKSLGNVARDEIGYEHVMVEAAIGYAPSVILDRAEGGDVDLIVIASHGRTGLERMLLGSVTERVVRRAPCPVFVVKPFGKSLVPVGRAPSAEAQ